MTCFTPCLFSFHPLPFPLSILLLTLGAGLGRGWGPERRERQTVNTVIRKWCKAGEQRGADGAWPLRQFPYISCPAGVLQHGAGAAWFSSPLCGCLRYLARQSPHYSPSPLSLFPLQAGSSSGPPVPTISPLFSLCFLCSLASCCPGATCVNQSQSTAAVVLEVR